MNQASTSVPSADLSRRAWQFIVIMSVVAMLGDITYEGARSINGVFLALLGASPAWIGFIVGFGEGLGYGLRILTGWISDRTKAYWPLTFVGYSLNLVAVPGLALVGAWEAAAGLVLLERVGKAIRGPARSALVSFAAKRVGPGKTFAIDEALDQIGAVTGPLLVALAIQLHASGDTLADFQTAFAVLLIPVALNLLLLSVARWSFPKPETFEPESPHPTHFRRAFWWLVMALALVGAGFADWALIALHLHRTAEWGPLWLAILYAAAMGGDAVAALLFGFWFDRHGLKVLVVAIAFSAGFAPLVFLGDASVTNAGVPWGVVAGVALWSVGMGTQESIFRASIALMVPKADRGRAYGLFFAIFGVSWWLGSWLMGVLYTEHLGVMVVFSVLAQLAAIPIVWHVARITRTEHGQSGS